MTNIFAHFRAAHGVRATPFPLLENSTVKSFLFNFGGFSTPFFSSNWAHRSASETLARQAESIYKAAQYSVREAHSHVCWCAFSATRTLAGSNKVMFWIVKRTLSFAVVCTEPEKPSYALQTTSTVPPIRETPSIRPCPSRYLRIFPNSTISKIVLLHSDIQLQSHLSFLQSPGHDRDRLKVPERPKW